MARDVAPLSMRIGSIVGVAGRLACIELATGKLLWQVETNKKYGVIQNFFGVGSTPPIPYKNMVLVMVGGSPADVSGLGNQISLARPNGTGMIAFDRDTGKEVYRVGNYLASYSAPSFPKSVGRHGALHSCAKA